MPLVSFLGTRTAIIPDDKVLLIDEYVGEVTRGELVVNAIVAGEILSEAGVLADETVVVQCRDGLSALYGILGSWSIGAIPAPIDKKMSHSHTEHVVKDCDAKAIVTDSSDSQEFPIPTVVFDHFRNRFSSPQYQVREFQPRVAREGNRAVLLQYTSGSTGAPKGVLHRIHAVESMIESVGSLYGLAEKDKVFSSAKLGFGYGLGNSVILPWAVGAATCLMGSDSDIFSCLESINKWKPTVFASVPRIWRGILAAAKTRRSVDISSVRMGISAGEYLPECLAEDLLKTLGVSPNSIWKCNGVAR